MTTEPLTFGLIGAGRIGRLHASNLQHRIPSAQLLMVSDPDLAAAAECLGSLKGAYTTDSREILGNPDIQAVIICSPTDTHAQLIEEAAAVGKQIFCEKPIAHDLARIDRALAAVEEAGVILQIGFNRRFDSGIQRVRQAVANGEIGEPHQAHIISRDPAPPGIDYIRSSGGIFLDMTIHDFDMACFLLCSEVEEVYATGSVRIDPSIGEAGDLDTVTVLMKFSGGTSCVIQNSRKAVYGYDQRVEVFGSHGEIGTENQFPNSATLRTKDSIRRDPPMRFFLDRYQESYVEELRQFIEAVTSGTASPVSGLDGRIPVVMALTAQRSLEENRPVRLNEIDPD